MSTHNVSWKQFNDNIDMFDDFLSESTKFAYRKIRTPGRYIYDKDEGDETIEDYND